MNNNPNEYGIEATDLTPDFFTMSDIAPGVSGTGAFIVFFTEKEMVFVDGSDGDCSDTLNKEQVAEFIAWLQAKHDEMITIKEESK